MSMCHRQAGEAMVWGWGGREGWWVPINAGGRGKMLLGRKVGEGWTRQDGGRNASSQGWVVVGLPCRLVMRWRPVGTTCQVEVASRAAPTLHALAP